MPHATRDGARIAYTDEGGGAPPVVLVHGWCCDRSCLEPLRAHFAARRRVVAIDLPGHGASDAPERDYAVPEQVNAMIDRFLFLSGLETR
jgi:pimeloyl-ACP methyl ester carboxylesterase